MAREKGTGSFRKITRSGKELWEYRIENKSFYAATKKDCRDKYQNWRNDSHENKIEKIVFLEDWALEWLKTYKYHKVADGTYYGYSLYVTKHIIPYFKNKKIKDIRPADIEKFMLEEEHYSFSCRKQIWFIINDIFKTAIQNKLCVENPCLNYKFNAKSKDKACKIKYFNKNDLNVLIEEALKLEDGYYILLPLYTGCRRGELAALKWSDIDDGFLKIDKSVYKTENGDFQIKAPKSGRQRIIGVTDKLYQVLAKIPRKGDYILGGENFLTLYQMHSRYKNAFEKINSNLQKQGKKPVPYLSMHKCRHTYATYLAEGGAAAKDIQELLGHSSISTTQIYFHFNKESIKNASNKLSY